MQVKVADQIIHYDIIHPAGTKNLLILHGWGHSGILWNHVANYLPDSIQCILVDLPGFGQSSIRHPLTLQDYTDIIKNFIVKMDLDTVNVLGHSFGGQLAVSIASTTPIDKLILVAPAIQRERNSFSKSWYRLLAIAARVKRILPASLTYHLSSGTNYSEATPLLKQVFQNLIKVDVTSQLAHLSMPVLCIWGEHDQEILGSAKQLVSQIPQGRLKVIYDAGHNLHLEKPRDVARMIERFI